MGGRRLAQAPAGTDQPTRGLRPVGLAAAPASQRVTTQPLQSWSLRKRWRRWSPSSREAAPLLPPWSPPRRSQPRLVRTVVRYPRVVTDFPRVALRQPRSLTTEQLTSLDITIAASPAAVRAWVLWEDGVEELVTGHAIAWTRRAVKVR